MHRRGSVPLLDFVVPVIRFLDMTCWQEHQHRPPGVSGAWNNPNAPVFIITCVVARLTFFLKPGSRSSAGDREGAGGGVRHRGVRYPPKTWWTIAASARWVRWSGGSGQAGPEECWEREVGGGVGGRTRWSIEVVLVLAQEEDGLRLEAADI